MVPRTVKKMFPQQREHGFSDHIDEALIAVTMSMLQIMHGIEDEKMWFVARKYGCLAYCLSNLT